MDAIAYQFQWYFKHTDIPVSQIKDHFRVYYHKQCTGYHITTQKERYKMTDEFTFEFSWDEEEVHDLSGISQGSYPDWGLLKLRWNGMVTLFAKGETLTIPGIIMPNGETWSRNGIKKGGNTRLYVFTLRIHFRG